MTNAVTPLYRVVEPQISNSPAGYACQVVGVDEHGAVAAIVHCRSEAAARAAILHLARLEPAWQFCICPRSSVAPSLFRMVSELDDERICDATGKTIDATEHEASSVEEADSEGALMLEPIQPPYRVVANRISDGYRLIVAENVGCGYIERMKRATELPGWTWFVEPMSAQRAAH